MSNSTTQLYFQQRLRVVSTACFADFPALTSSYLSDCDGNQIVLTLPNLQKKIIAKAVLKG